MIVSFDYVINFQIIGLIVGVIGISFLLFLYFLNYKKYYETAQILVNTLFPLMMLILGVCYGEATGTEYNLIIFITTAFFFHKKTITKFSLAIYNIFIYFFLRYYWATHVSMFAYIVTPITEPITFIMAAAATITVVFTFLKENEKYDKKNEDLLQNLAKNNEELKIANQELERFAYIASHDLKTPLRTILGYTELLERDFNKGKIDDFPTYFAQIKQGTLQMNDLIKTTLEYSRINHIDNDKSWIDLNTVVENIQNAYANNQNVKITFEDLPIIYAEENQILSLFQNLIENGFKYNEQTLKTIEVSHESTTDKYLISIKDNGIGIPEQFHDQIFTMFKRLHTNQQYEGTGLGLAICEKIIDNMNGKISISSIVKEGTTFHIELPKI
jgi:signal transduction histidine kinase